MNLGNGRIRHVGLATCVAVLTSLAVTGGGPPGGGGHDDAPTPTPPAAEEFSPVKGPTIRVTANVLVGEELDLGAPGPSIGDQFIFSGRLLSVEDPDREVGRFSEFCVITDLERNAGLCSLTAVLAGGQIAVQGEQEGLPAPVSVTNAITGGTGPFRKAQGEMTLRVLTAATWDITFKLAH